MDVQDSKMDWLYEQFEKSQAAINSLEDSLANLQEVVYQNAITIEELKQQTANNESTQAD